MCRPKLHRLGESGSEKAGGGTSAKKPGAAGNGGEEGRRRPNPLAFQGYGFVERRESAMVDTGRQDLFPFQRAGKRAKPLGLLRKTKAVGLAALSGQFAEPAA